MPGPFERLRKRIEGMRAPERAAVGGAAMLVGAGPAVLPVMVASPHPDSPQVRAGRSLRERLRTLPERTEQSAAVTTGNPILIGAGVGRRLKAKLDSLRAPGEEGGDPAKVAAQERDFYAANESALREQAEQELNQLGREQGAQMEAEEAKKKAMKAEADLRGR